MVDHNDNNDFETASEAPSSDEVQYDPPSMGEPTPAIGFPGAGTSRDWPMPERHPLATIFRPLTDDELGQLVDDIRAHGLREPITLHPDGRVLDGWGRVTACRQACVTPTFRTFDASDPLAFVVSANLCRRHLTSSQRGMVAARIAHLKVGRPAAVKHSAVAISRLPPAEQVRAIGEQRKKEHASDKAYRKLRQSSAGRWSPGAS
jgi:hypothetical protein